MNLFKQYQEYVKDNPNGLWFKRKLYGWGWTPVKWQGWLVILIFVLFMFLNVSNLGQFPTDSETTWFLFRILISVILLIIICYKKGEKPKWQWGTKR